jgi:chorismate synthase
MPSNFFGEFFRITTWGESHGTAVGFTIDGMPSGVKINIDTIMEHLKWRKPGGELTSPRQEQDIPEILSGVFENKTTGAPLTVIFKNMNVQKSQYNELKDKFRPGHANYTYIEKYGVYDHNGGGRASARETVCRVAAGAIAQQLLSHLGIQVHTFLSNIGEVKLPSNFIPSKTQLKSIFDSPVFCPHHETSTNMVELIKKIKSEGNSVGGSVSFIIEGAPSGLGDPVYQKLEAKLAYAMLTIPASKGFEIGSGFNSTTLTGKEHNDTWENNSDNIRQVGNNCGGILGGISTGETIYGKVAFKPTSSIKIPQKTVDLSGNNTTINIPESGRHDPCVAIRAAAVVKAMCYLTIADSYLANKVARAN